MASAMVSAFTNRPIRSKLAMTGEITLRGNVLPVGGIKEKVLAARRSGIEILVMPDANRKNLEEIPRALRRNLTFIFVRHISEVFEAALAEVDRRDPTLVLHRDVAAAEAMLQT
jgi:ATP-dependent Lon protease